MSCQCGYLREAVSTAMNQGLRDRTTIAVVRRLEPVFLNERGLGPNPITCRVRWNGGPSRSASGERLIV